MPLCVWISLSVRESVPLNSMSTTAWNKLTLSSFTPLRGEGGGKGGMRQGSGAACWGRHPGSLNISTAWRRGGEGEGRGGGDGKDKEAAGTVPPPIPLTLGTAP